MKIITHSGPLTNRQPPQPTPIGELRGSCRWQAAIRQLGKRPNVERESHLTLAADG
jgi:hypothetical protein